LFNHKFRESQVDIAPRGVIFPFLVPIIVDKTVNFGDFGTLAGLGIYFLSFIIVGVAFLFLPFFKALFLGFKSFRYGTICLISSTLFLSFILPYIVNSMFLDSFRLVFLMGGVIGYLFLYTKFCTVKNLIKLGWTQIDDEM